MIERLYHLPVFWMALVIIAGTLFFTAIIGVTILSLARDGRARIFKTMSPVMLTPLAVVFGLLVGFLSAQVWSTGTFSRVQLCDTAECNSAIQQSVTLRYSEDH
jgi:hypothetical protein